jgi:DNA-binding protein HU-beta
LPSERLAQKQPGLGINPRILLGGAKSQASKQGVIHVNKTELRDAIAQHADLTNAQADKALEAVITSITSTVAKGEKVTLPGFGTFESRERSARTGRNPQTGETMEIAASKAPAFKAGSAFKSAVNG